MSLGPVNKNFKNYKSMIIPDKKKFPQNTFKIREAVKEYTNVDQDFIEKPNFAPFNDPFSFCKTKIYFNKYICIVYDCILYPKYEITHEYPVLKSNKNNQLSSLEYIFIYINTKNPELKNSRNSSSFLSNIFANKYELKIEFLNETKFKKRYTNNYI